MENNAQSKSKKIQNYKLGDSESMMQLAVELAKFIKENKLYQNIQGKEFVNVEGWQYAGARLGLVPIVEGVVNHSTESEIKYQAAVYLVDLNRNREQVGSGFAVCSNKEQGKKFYQEFAIESMAQTRAIGKAYRNLLAWIIRAAGYEPTPAEEMDYSDNIPDVKVEKYPQPTPINVTHPKKDEPEITEPSEAPSNGKKYASPKQKEQIIRLLNNPVITREEKTKMLLNINKIDEERANESIEKLKKVIEEREEQSNAAD